MQYMFCWMHSPHVVIPATLVYRSRHFTVEILTKLQKSNLDISQDQDIAFGGISSSSISKTYWFQRGMTSSLISSCWSSGPIVDDISRPLTCIHIRSERWISGQSLRHEQPLVVCRHAHHSRWRPGLGGDVELGSSLGVLAAVDRARAARTAVRAANLEWSACRENLITNAARA